MSVKKVERRYAFLGRPIGVDAPLGEMLYLLDPVTRSRTLEPGHPSVNVTGWAALGTLGEVLHVERVPLGVWMGGTWMLTPICHCEEKWHG